MLGRATATTKAAVAKTAVRVILAVVEVESEVSLVAASLVVLA